jgi:hypothetical protein
MKSISLASSDKFLCIDDADFDLVSQYRWGWSGRDVRSTTYPRIKVHRLIVNPRDNEIVDHINGDTLDNRRCNLRVATRMQNMWNRKTNENNKVGLKGVTWRQDCHKYQAQIRVNKKTVFLGRFKTAIEAHKAYVEASNKYYGQFSYYYDGKGNPPEKDKLVDDVWDTEPIVLWSNNKSQEYLLIQRTLLQSMSKEWQRDFLKLILQMQEHFGYKSNGEFKISRKDKSSKFIQDPLADYEQGRRIVTKEEL